MKKGIALITGTLAASSMTSAAAVVVAGWDSWSSNSAPASTLTAAGVTATMAVSGVGGNWSIGDSGADPGRGSSDDTTWGSFDGNGSAASTTTNVGTANITLTNAKTGGTFLMTITNNSASDFGMESLHFDAYAFRQFAARTFEVNVDSGDLTVGNVFTSSSQQITSVGNANSHASHDEYDIDLTGLADSTLAVGESAVFSLVFSGGAGTNNGGHHLFVDNLAFSGEAIPEPSSAAFLGLAGLALILRRRK